MHDVMRKRLLRKLESLPEERLYQVLDYIEFLESRYATAPAPSPSTIQKFGEQLEDRLRAMSVGPRAVTGTMRLIGTAGRVLDGITEAGRDLIRTLEPAPGAAPTAPRPVVRPAEPERHAAQEPDAPPPGASAVPTAGPRTDATETAGG